MEITLWFVIVGAVFVVMALTTSLVQRLPLSPAMLYLLIGIGIGPAGLGLLRIDPIADAALLEHLTEIAVLVSLFTAGLKLRARITDRMWRIPLRLAVVAMVVTIGLIAAVGSTWLGLPLGVALLLGAILSPTDPVLASDVQVEDPSDRDRLRFGLTGEAGLNDGTAFPFVLLGLGMLGLHDLGAFGLRWVAVDVLYAIAAGLAIGWALGAGCGRLVVYLRSRHQAAVGLDDFLALGLIALSYGVAHAVAAYGFLAVFAAGLALRAIERRANGPESTKMADLPGEVSAEDLATHPEHAPTYMAQAILAFNEQLERIAEVAVVLVIGALLVPLLPYVPPAAIWFVPLLFLVIRPASVLLALLGARVGRAQRPLFAWFGIRGVGSIYYLMYAITHGLAEPYSTPLMALTVLTVTASIIVHGISVTPLMRGYSQRTARGVPAS